MTLDDWLQFTEHFFDFITSYSDIKTLREWSDWEEKMDEVLQDMAYEDAMGCTFDDLIELAGIKGEIDMARKQHIENKRMKKKDEDFN